MKPPPPLHSSVDRRSSDEWRRRRRMLAYTASMLLIAGGAWGGYAYISSAPQRAEVIFQDGMRRMANGKYPEAVKLFTKATGTWPQLADGYLERGLAHQNLLQFDAALQDFEHAIQVDPNLAAAHTALGTIYRRRGDTVRAINEFSSSIDLEENVDALYQRGQTYESMGQYQKALDDYNQAIAQMPAAPYIYRSRASVRDALGDRDNAESDRQRAVALEHHVL